MLHLASDGQGHKCLPAPGVQGSVLSMVFAAGSCPAPDAPACGPGFQVLPYLFSCSQRSSGAKKQQIHESSRPLSIERPGAVHPWVSAQLRNSVQPSHLFIQDPTMPPNPAPNPLTQLEEARRRLEEEEKRASKLPSKQRYRAIWESRASTCKGPCRCRGYALEWSSLRSEVHT